MPISQQTVLSIYGELCDLADMGEKLAQLIAQGDMLRSRPKRAAEIERLALELALATQRRQRIALTAILGDEPSINANPLTGRI